MFFFDLAMELLKSTSINENAIKLKERKQPPYELIYALSPVELEILKAYIITHQKTRFIQLSKSFASAPIFFDKKLDNSLCLCINYRDLNNLTIKNWYPFPLIGETLDQPS